MGRSAITLVTPTGPGAEHAASLLRAIFDRWPVGPAPSHRVVTFDQAWADRSLLRQTVVVSLEDGAPGSALYKLIDCLEESSSAGLVLTAPKSKLDLSGGGVLGAPASLDAPVLAGMLLALLERQRAVDSVLGELAGARRAQGGLADQMNQMHEELQLAASVQREFLPACLPLAPGLEFGVLFRPCGYVSGDIYNVARLDDRRVGFFVADAVGHGVPAALMTMILCRGLLMTEPGADGSRAPRIVPPGEALGRLNEALLRGQANSRRFATAVYGVIDRVDRTVTLASAGHPPPLRLRPGRAAEPVPTDGCLLGVFDDAQFDEATFALADDEALLVFSDGFEMAFANAEKRAPSVERKPFRREPNALYLNHFVQLAELRRSEGMPAAIDLLRRHLDEASGSLHQVDDLTALVIAGDRAAQSAAA